MIISYKGSSQKAKELQIDTITDLDTINSDQFLSMRKRGDIKLSPFF